MSSHINIFSSSDYVNSNNNKNASLLIQNAGGLPENTQMPSMLVYNTVNPIQDFSNTENLIFSISGDRVSVGPEYGDSSFNVLGNSLFTGNINILGNLNTTGKTTHGGGDFSHDGTMYLSDVIISGKTQMMGSLDISNTVTIDGSLNVTNDANINGLTVGVGGGDKPSNCIVGQSALSENQFGTYNSAFGHSAGKNNINGDNNTYIGYGTDNSGNNNYDNSTAIGYNAKITTSDQIVLGKTTDSSGNAPTVYIPGNVGIGTDNSGGLYALDINGGAYVRGNLIVNNGVNINGLNIGFGGGDISTNCVFGQKALSENDRGSYNSAFGYNAGSTNIDGVNNTFLGYNTTANASNYNNSTALGYNATITSSDQIVLGKTSDNNGNAPTVYIPGNVGIGTDNLDGPYAVDVDGDMRIDGSLNITSGGATINGVTTFNSSVYGVTTQEYDEVVGNKFATLDWVNWFIQNEGGLWKLSPENNTHIYNNHFRNVGIGTQNPTTTLDVSGGVNISNHLDVSGGATIYGSATIHDGLNVSGGARFHGATTFDNQVNGQTVKEYDDNNKNTFATLDWVDWFIKNEGGVWSVNASNNNYIHNTNLNSLVGIGTTNPTTTLDVSGGVNISNHLDVSNGAIIDGGATINNGLTVNNELIVHNGAIISGSMTVSDSITLNGSMSVTDGMLVEGGATIEGGATFEGGATIDGSVNIVGYTEISGNTVIDGFASVKKFSVGTNWIDPSYTLYVSGDMASDGDIYHTGTVKHVGKINMSGAINIDGDSIHTGKSTHHGNHTHTGGIMNINILDVSGNSTMMGMLDVYSGCSIGGSVDVSGGMTVNGSSSFTGPVTGKTSSNTTGSEFATL